MWNDVTHYKDKKLQIMKRAQLVIADLWACANASKTDTEFTKLPMGNLFFRTQLWDSLKWKTLSLIER